MAPYSNPLMPNLDQLEKMNQDLTRMMPKEMASAVNLLAHPVAGAAAMSALGFGLANHAFGVWLGALSGAAEARSGFSSRSSTISKRPSVSETAPAPRRARRPRP